MLSTVRHIPPADVLDPTRSFVKRRASWLCCSLAVFAGCATSPFAHHAGPWDVAALSKSPAFTWGGTTGLVQELFFKGEPLNGKPTRVFAYLARPAVDLNRGSAESRAAAKWPAMVLVHGGGGKAFKEWAEHWAQHGYVAIAMDLSGNGPNGPLPDGGPDQSDETKFRNFTEADARDMWTYHAVAAVVRAHSLLRSLPEVDAERTGITGISWGGYLTCIVAGIDPRFKVAVPVYGCGFLGENSVWKDDALAKMTPNARALWLRLFDPSEYLARMRRPILFVNGTTDFAYPLDSYQKSYRLVPARWRHVSVAVDRKHGHIWTFPEVDAFVDHVLRGKRALVRVSTPTLTSTRLTAKLDRAAPFNEGSLCYTTNSGPWQKRLWQTTRAHVEGRRISAPLPSARPLAAFFAIQDSAGRHVSSEHVTLPIR
jgi:dienelactone hydrolase